MGFIKELMTGNVYKVEHINVDELVDSAFVKALRKKLNMINRICINAWDQKENG